MLTLTSSLARSGRARRHPHRPVRRLLFFAIHLAIALANLGPSDPGNPNDASIAVFNASAVRSSSPPRSTATARTARWIRAWRWPGRSAAEGGGAGDRSESAHSERLQGVRADGARPARALAGGAPSAAGRGVVDRGRLARRSLRTVEEPFLEEPAMTTPIPTHDLKAEARRTLEEIRTLRDEVRVQLHLASMDAKDQWKKLEPHVADAEKLATDIGETSRAALSDVLRRIRKFRASIKA